MYLRDVITYNRYFGYECPSLNLTIPHHQCNCNGLLSVKVAVPHCWRPHCPYHVVIAKSIHPSANVPTTSQAHASPSKPDVQNPLYPELKDELIESYA